MAGSGPGAGNCPPTPKPPSMQPPQELPERLTRSFAVAEFRYTMRAKRTILEPLFAQMQLVGAEYRTRRDLIQGWTDLRVLDEFMDPAGRLRLQEHGKNKGIYEDTAATIVLLVVAQMERFYKATDISLYDRGRECYLRGVKFSKALKVLANQYKHLGSWLSKTGQARDEHEVSLLVDDPYRADAAAEFLLRSGFVEYADLENSILSCTEGIVERPLVVDDGGELATVRLQYDPQTGSHP
jgi:hypothetical protein